MTTWSHTSDDSDPSNPTWSHSSDDSDSTRPSWESESFYTDLISPYGDFSESTDLTSFWDDSLDSVTIQNLDATTPVSIDSGSLKILGNANVDVSYYIKAIPVVKGATYTIAGTTAACSSHTLIIKGGSTSAGDEYISLLITASGLPTAFADETSLGGPLTFTTTTDTFYLYIYMGTSISAYMSIDNISLSGPSVKSPPSFSYVWNPHAWKVQSKYDWEDLSAYDWEEWNRIF
jgi:hypothetical protein